MLHNQTYHVIGLMSGSSLDGLDLCYSEFNVDKLQLANNLTYKIIKADCVEYTHEFRERLRNASNLSVFEFAKLHSDLGKYFGKLTKNFIQKNNIEKIDFIASHGQTIFHQPDLSFTTQIGCGAQIAAQTNCKVVCDLRTSDVANNGQGAPIVPIAEKYVFQDFNVFLNIGGIANIAFHNNENVTAFDVCAANTVLNYLARQKGLEYDKDGKLARSGTVIQNLLLELNKIDFCHQAPPKSLGSEHIYEDWIPLFDKYDDSIEDKLATMVEHISMQVGNQINSSFNIHHSTLLITGGGALNTFLTERIQQHTSLKVVVPDILTVQYKEALAMAFIGLLRILEIPNCLASVTGAKKDVIGGAVYLP